MELFFGGVTAQLPAWRCSGLSDRIENRTLAIACLFSFRHEGIVSEDGPLDHTNDLAEIEFKLFRVFIVIKAASFILLTKGIAKFSIN